MIHKHLLALRIRLRDVFFGPAYHRADHAALSPRGSRRGVRAVLFGVGALWALLVGADNAARFGQRTPKSWRYFQGPREFNEHPNVARRPEPIRDDLLRTVGVAALTAPYRAAEDTARTWLATDANGFRSVRTGPPFDAVLCGDSFSNNNNFADSLAKTTGLSVGNLAIEGRGTLTMARYLETPPQACKRARLVLWVSTQRAGLADFEALEQARRQLQDPSTLKAWQESLLWPANLDLYLTGSSSIKPLFDRASKEIKWKALHKNTDLIVLGRTDLPPGVAPMLYLAADESIRPAPTAAADVAKIADRIADVSRELRARGKQLVFAVAPEKGNVYRERLPLALTPRDNYVTDLNRALQARGVAVVDLYSGLRAVALAHPDRLYYYATDTHWTPRGEGVAAGIIADSLRRWHMNQRAASNR